MDDKHQPTDGYRGASDAEPRHPAEVLADVDPADAPDVAEELADRLAEELEGPPAGHSDATDRSSGGDMESEVE